MNADLVLTTVGAGFLLLFYGASFLPRLLRSRGPDHAHVVEALRLLQLEPRYYGVSPVTGRVDGVNVRISERLTLAERESERGPEIFVEIADELVLPVRISAEAILPGLLRGTDALTGEPRFDDRVRIDAADPVPALAMLDGEVRDAVLAATTDGGWYDGRRWAMSIADASWTGPRIAAAVRGLVRAHRALREAASRSTPEGLAAIAVRDRHAGVRHRALTLLVERGIASRSLLQSRTGDVDAGVRYLAAKALGADGVGTLRTLVDGGSRTWKVRAASALATIPLDPEVTRRVEDVLAAALGDAELADAALLGLARIGTARSIEALMRVEAEGATAELRRAARDVLAQVRSRLDPARAGGLSIAEAAEQGAVSEATSDRGALSHARSDS